MASKGTGSSLFGTSNVRTDEYVLIAKVCVDNGSTIEQAAIEIEAIDDMLGILKMQSLFNWQRFTPTGRRRKNSDLTYALDGRIDKLVQDLKNLEDESKSRTP